MSNWTLGVFCELHGIGAASGLVIERENLYVVSDHSSYLYHYDLNKKQLAKVALVDNAQDIVSKKEKFDLESVVKKDNSLYLFGSGSTQKRDQLFQYDLNTQKVSIVDVSVLYQALRHKIGLNNDELNIEGVIYDTQRWLFFQRGNGATAQNGVFILNSEYLDSNATIEFIPFQLPSINGVLASFTDAILVNKDIYFLAAVEDTTSTYDDGEVLGSFIGCLDLSQQRIKYIQQITNTHKFEGLAFYQQNKDKVEFLLCEDNDSDELSSTIYQLTLNLPLAET